MSAPSAERPAVFVTGSTMRHVVVMTTTGAIGLVAIFAVDFLTLLYVSWLNDTRLTAAVGLASVILFITMSVNIGFMIAVGALVSRAIGAGDPRRARHVAGSAVAWMGVCGIVLSLAVLPLMPAGLTLLGAKGEVHSAALRFLWIVMPSNVLVALGMGFSGVLRACGDAKRAMYVTLSAGIATAILDPILIFGLGLGLDGAAIAVIGARLILCLVGYLGAVGVHNLVARPSVEQMRADMAPILAIAIPAVLTNLASPLALAVLASVMARYGDGVLAANTIIDRIVPLAYGVVFALSGAVGPILGQNLGANRYDRVSGALRDSLVVMVIYIVAVWIVLVLLRNQIPRLFGVTGEIADLVAFFCLISGPTWLFLGALFVGNAAFNNLGFPFYATAFNWGRATLGTIPFTLVGAWLGGPEGASVGFAAGSALFGIGAAWVAFRVVGTLEAKAKAGIVP